MTPPRLLSRVNRAAGRLAEGYSNARFEEERGEEIGELGEAFNATAASLREMMPRLDEQSRRDDFGPPVTFMGRALGVLRTTAPVDPAAGVEETARLGTAASVAGVRIGTVRSCERTQLQASTDGLTGLMNRRTFETSARSIVRHGGPLAVGAPRGRDHAR